MSNKTTYTILGVLMILLVVIMSTCLQVKKVPDVKWNKKYEYDITEPNGTWLFMSMLKESFGSDKVILPANDSMTYNSLNNNNLYIYLGYSTKIGYSKKDSIIEWIKKGNEALIISKLTNFDLPNLDESDSLDYYSTETSNFRDTLLSFTYVTKKDSILKSATYHSYGKTLDEYTYQLFYHFEHDFYDGYRPLINLGDTASILITKDYGEGKIYFHSAPELFVNVASFQDYYLDHFNYVISHFNPDTIFLDQADENYNNNNETEKESPLQFILASPPLKWAYYTLLLGLLFYVWFGSKRKQKPIKTIEENKNTSLEYVQTVSTLYESQNQNRKLVQHMKHIFFEKIKSKYFLDQSNPEYNHLLSRKSKVNQAEIDKIINKLNSSEHYEFTDDQLNTLYHQLENFYKNCK